MALEIYNQATAQQQSKARVLLLGPPKTGKTTCLALGAPKPLILNCDGKNATKGAANQGATFSAIDVSSAATWIAACKLACEEVVKGNFKSIIVDTASLLNYTLISEAKRRGEKGWDIYTKATEAAMVGFDMLREADAHLFVNSHMKVELDTVSGILPDVKGELKARIPQVIDDWVLLYVDAATGSRKFLLGPQKSWPHSGRNVKRTCEIDADVGLLFKELGLNP